MLIILGVVALGLVWWFVSSAIQTASGGPLVGRAPSRSPHSAPRSRSTPLVLGPPVADAVVEMVGVSKSYGRGERRRLALDSLDLAVPGGEVFGLLGQNGAGKTTAMRCMLGLVRPTAGTCRILGADSGRDLHRVIGRVGALIETPGLSPSLSGRRNLLLLARLERMGRGEVDRALEAAGLADRADDAVATYSLGMRQRLGVAAALLRDPEVLILDEPANGLDPAGIAEIRHLLVGLAREGRTVIVSSHLLTRSRRSATGWPSSRRAAAWPSARSATCSPPPAPARSSSAWRIWTPPSAPSPRLGSTAAVTHGALRVACAPADGARVTEILAAERLYVSEMRPVKPTLGGRLSRPDLAGYRGTR